MRNFIRLNLFVFLILTIHPTIAGTPVEAEFNKFFNAPLKSYQHSNVKVNVDNQDWQDGEIAVTNMSNDQMQITVGFTLKSVEKVLILKLPESGYDLDGSIDEKCQNDYIFVAGYSMDPTANITELTFRMRSHCGGGPHTIVAWVRTANGQYYLGNRTFFAFTADGVNSW